MVSRRNRVMIGLLWGLASALIAPLIAFADPIGVAGVGGHSFISIGTNRVAVSYATDDCDGTGTTCGPTLVDTSAGFKLLDLDATAAAPSTDGLVEFEVVSERVFTPTGTQLVVFTLQASDGASTFYTVPIATVNGVPCDTSLCNLFNGDSTPNDYFAAKYSETQPNRIGVYLKDVCGSIVAQSGGAALPTYCMADGSVKPPKRGTLTSAGTPTIFNFRGFVNLAADTSSVGDTTSTEESERGDFLVRVQAGAGFHAGGCPAAAADVYFPGDSELLLNPSVFSSADYARSDTSFTTLVSVANPNALVSMPTGFRSNALVVASDFSGSPKMPGFTNSDLSADHPYELAFGFRDHAGAFAEKEGAVGDQFPCSASGVRAFPIEGFLSQSKCFIATAAYRDSEAWGVHVLREFRDRILVRSTLGRAFVEAYYGWSPDAARWLIRHPEYRLPVLVLLMPLQALAFVFIQPGLAFALALVWVLGAALLFVRRLGGASSA